MTGVISYDLLVGDDMESVEGAFRLPDGAWQVIVVAKAPVRSPEVRRATWESGVTGLSVSFPRAARLDKAAVVEVLGRAFGVGVWVEVRGPDSMTLR